jgi:hypothetical protein
MDIKADSGTPRPDSSPPRPPARCNVISVLFPFVGLLGAGLAFLIGESLDWYWAQSLNAALWTLGASGVLGLLLAVIALVRAEKALAVTIIGLILNGGLLLCFLN